MGSVGWFEILLIAILVVLLFGARKLPEIGKGLGEGIRSFRSAIRGDEPGQGKDDRTGTGGGPNR
jgi:sec-independent protein translocase protein TatA